MQMWRYEVRMLSRLGDLVTRSVQVLPDWEYQIPECREFVEKKAEAALRGMEGVTEKTKFEYPGWRQFTFGGESEHE